MTTRDLMQTDIGACAPDDDLATVLLLMRDWRCGWVPVVDGKGLVVGVITDRDAAMAMLDHPSRSALHVRAREAMTPDLVTCAPSDTVRAVLAKMALHHVRRLPVLDDDRHLQGVISVDDILRLPQQRLPQPALIVEALRAIVSRPTAADLHRQRSRVV